CPVMVTTTVYKPVEKLYFLYDGEPSSVYAIKMFDYLMHLYRHLPAEVVSIKRKKDSMHVPDNRLMKEFMKRHFPNAEYTVLKGEPEEVVINYLSDQRTNALVVLGAYQRSTVSRWFRASLADYLIKELRLPLFIAHK
ncbi:MAG: universal stress protein, partial [Chitinophagaceae bacterium]